MITKRKEKKSRKMRGSRVCGWGRTGQHRKHGGKGGRRGSGLHKHKWTYIIKYMPDYFGKKGFNRPKCLLKAPRTINVGELSEMVDKLVEAGLAKVSEGLYVINVRELGYSKVLGEGKVTKPLCVVTPLITEKAKEKIEASGGKVVMESL
ncbi:MAG: uL15 family ribosomal protein [Nitrososphaerota archaeon]|nr:uL15 family ribosomal protein [Nitrososphaerota archaeon]